MVNKTFKKNFTAAATAPPQRLLVAALYWAITSTQHPRKKMFLLHAPRATVAKT